MKNKMHIGKILTISMLKETEIGQKIRRKMKKKKATKKEKKEVRDYKKFIIPFFDKGYTITDMFRIKNMARHMVSSK